MTSHDSLSAPRNGYMGASRGDTDSGAMLLSDWSFSNSRVVGLYIQLGNTAAWLYIQLGNTAAWLYLIPTWLYIQLGNTVTWLYIQLGNTQT